MQLLALPTAALVAWGVGRTRARAMACGAGFVVGGLLAFSMPELPPHSASDVRPWVGLLSALGASLPGAVSFGVLAPLAVFWRFLGRWSLATTVAWLASHTAVTVALRRAEPRTLALSAAVLAGCLLATGSALLGLEAAILAATAWRGRGHVLYALLLLSGVLLSELGLWSLPLAVLPLAPRWWIPATLVLPAWIWGGWGLSAL